MLSVACSRAALSPAVVRLERASRELAATFIYEGICHGRDPLDLFDDSEHQMFWFAGGAKRMASELGAAAVERERTPTPIPQAASPEPESASPLLAARARRARKTVRVVPPSLQPKPPPGLPDDAVPEGEASAAPDQRSKASKALVRMKLLALRERRGVLEAAVDELLDPLAAPNVPAMDVAVMLLFLCEMEAEALPVPVACKEAVALSTAYSGDEQRSHRHVHGILAAYARERMSIAD